MELTLFFTSQEERLNWMNTNDLSSLLGVTSIKTKNSHNKMPGFWLEIMFSKGQEGREQHKKLRQIVKQNQIAENVFYPLKDMGPKDLEQGWVLKYQLYHRDLSEEKWKLFYKEIKSHMTGDRMDTAYCGVLILLKYNPFFFKRYRRYYLLEELAYHYEEKGNLGKAMKCLKTQTILQPDSVEPYLNMSSFYIINNMEEEAISLCQEALKKYPYDNYLISNLIIALSNIGSYEYAVEYIRKAVEKYPQNGFLWKLMGDVLYELENTKGAISCYKRALHRKHEMLEEFQVDLYSGMAACYYEEENYKEAIKYYRRVLGLTPDDSYTLMSLSQIYFYHFDNSNMALKLTKKLLDQVPDSGYGHYQIGLIYSKLKNVEKAKWHLYRARRIMPYYQPVHEAIQFLKQIQQSNSSTS